MISKNIALISVMLLLAFCVSAFTLKFAKASDYTKQNPPASTIDASISNDILSVAIQDVLSSTGIGTFTIKTGTNHPNPGQNVFYGGHDDSPWSTFTTIRVEDTQKEYVTSAYGKTASPGYTVEFLDNCNPVVTVLSPTSATVVWRTAENLQVTLLLVVRGTTVADTMVQVTVTVENLDTVLHSVAIRHEWDIMIDGNDGSYIRPWTDPSTPQSWTNAEIDYGAPSFQFWETTNDPNSPIFSIYGSVSIPTVSPAPTVPDRLVYASWPSSYGTAYTYSPSGGVLSDSAVLYYYNAASISPGAEISRTAYVTTVVQTALNSLVWSTDSSGNLKTTFAVGDSVYVKGSSLPASDDVMIYVIPDGQSAVLANVVASAPATTTASGDLPNTLVWSPLLTAGQYDIWVDVNKNGVFDAGDVLNNQAGGIYAFSVTTPENIVPEVPLGTIVSSALMIAALSAYISMPRLTRRRKQVNL